MTAEIAPHITCKILRWSSHSCIPPTPQGSSLWGASAAGARRAQRSPKSGKPVLFLLINVYFWFSCFGLVLGGRGVVFRVLGGKEAQVAHAFCPSSPGYAAPALAGGKKHPCCSPCLRAPLHPPLHSPPSPTEPPPCSKFSIPGAFGP